MSIYVSPYAGEWIEISIIIISYQIDIVSPYAGEWIEIAEYCLWIFAVRVSPYAGEWIEMETRDAQGIRW